MAEGGIPAPGGGLAKSSEFITYTLGKSICKDGMKENDS